MQSQVGTLTERPEVTTAMAEELRQDGIVIPQSATLPTVEGSLSSAPGGGQNAFPPTHDSAFPEVLQSHCLRI
jgi:hypothetical protein